MGVDSVSASDRSLGSGASCWDSAYSDAQSGNSSSASEMASVAEHGVEVVYRPALPDIHTSPAVDRVQPLRSV